MVKDMESYRYEIVSENGRGKFKKKVKLKNIEMVSKTFRGKGCSLFKCHLGYYCATHRCRSKIYDNPKDIPQKEVDFVATTG